MRRMVPVLAILAAVAPALAQAPESPYAGQQHRMIKSLSAEDMRDLTEGRGMGLAKAAELNGYPGMIHVLELAEPLQLTPDQRAATEALFHRMQAEARRLGAAILQAESELEQRFQHRHIDLASLQAATAAIAILQGKLRAVHLAAHLEQAALLTPAQVAEYGRRRGYHSTPAGVQHGGHRRH